MARARQRQVVPDRLDLRLGDLLNLLGALAAHSRVLVWSVVRVG